MVLKLQQVQLKLHFLIKHFFIKNPSFKLKKNSVSDQVTKLTEIINKNFRLEKE